MDSATELKAELKKAFQLSGFVTLIVVTLILFNTARISSATPPSAA